MEHGVDGNGRLCGVSGGLLGLLVLVVVLAQLRLRVSRRLPRHPAGREGPLALLGVLLLGLVGAAAHVAAASHHDTYLVLVVAARHGVARVASAVACGRPLARLGILPLLQAEASLRDVVAAVAHLRRLLQAGTRAGEAEASQNGVGGAGMNALAGDRDVVLRGADREDAAVAKVHFSCEVLRDAADAEARPLGHGLVLAEPVVGDGAVVRKASHRAEDVLEEAAAFFCVAAAHAGEHVAPLLALVLLVVLHGGVA